MSETRQPLLKVRNLKKHFNKNNGLFNFNKKVLTAVDGINFEIYEGETFGLVGESGCGKSTTGRTIIKLYKATDGEVFFQGHRIAAGTLELKQQLQDLRTSTKTQIADLKADTGIDEEIKKEQIETLKDELSRFSKEAKSEMRSRKSDSNKKNKKIMKDIQMIFQDPYASLNPRMTVTDIIAEGIDTHHIFDEHDNPNLAKQEKIYELLESVGLKKEHASRYPHEFSGGQRQRIGIARALAVEPKLIICDEPISALDVSIQAQVVNMLEDFQKRDGLTYLFIAHDLSMVKYISDRIGVMYLGHMMEVTTSDELYEFPFHPYTKALLSSVPVPDPDANKRGKRIVLEGDVPSPINPKPGCRFASRCRYAKTEITKDGVPSFVDALEGKYAFEKVVNPADDEIIVLQGDYITREIADLINSLSFESFNIRREKCFNETPALVEVKKEHFTACHFVKEINNLS